MKDQTPDASEIERKVHDLALSMERVRTAQAEADDVVVDMKHAKHTRLELLAADLESVIADVPEGNDQFEFALTSGESPRFWIDMTSFVRMGSDGREYEFVKDTRLGRTILGRSQDREKIGGRVADYVAERILQREREIEGDWVAVQEIEGAEAPGASAPARAANYSGLSVFGWFVFGIVAGAAALAALDWFGYLETAAGWLSN